MSWLGLDWGTRFVGYATADTEGLVVTPRGFFERKVPQNKAWQLFEQDVAQLRALVAQWEITGIVLGLPLNADGTQSPNSLACEHLAREITAKLGITVELIDERLTSWDAKGHAGAAALILQARFR